MAAGETTYCPNCGERISARAKFCPSCGARQEDFRVPAPAPDPPPAAAPDSPPLVDDPPPAAVDESAPAVDEPAAPADEPAPAVDEPAGAPEEPPAADSTPAAAESTPVAEEPPSAADSPPAADAPRREARPLHERIGEVDPQAGELSQLIAGQLAVPGVVAAGLAAVIAATIVLVAGLVIAFVTPDGSIVGLLGRDVNIVTEAFRQAVGTLLAPVVDKGPLSSGSGRLTPMLFVAIPLGAVAFATRRQMHRTAEARPATRVAWAAMVALPFALLMLVLAVLGGDSDTTGISMSPAGAFGLGLLWGVVGGVAGAASALDLGSGGVAGERPRVRAALAAAAAALRPLAAVLVACAALALVAWLAGVGANAADARGGRSAATALIEETAFVADHGIHLAELGAGARFHTDGPGALGLPVPVSQAGDVPGADGGLRIFSYHDALPAYVFLPALIIVMGLVALGALYAGFAAARAAGGRTLPAGAAWGALTGPTWAVAMVIFNALAGGFFHGAAEGASVFGVFLLGGAVLGAAGGALALSGAPAQAAPA